MSYLPRLSAFTVALLSIFALISVAYLLPKTRAQNQVITASREKKPDFVPGELLVRFRPGSAAARNKSRTSVNLSMANGRNLPVEVNHFGGSEILEGLMLARVPAEDTLAAVKALGARSDVLYAEPNFIRYAHVVPNDPRYVDLIGLHNTTGGIRAEATWDTTTGSQNVVVGVIDSGIDTGHKDLKDNIFVNTGEVPTNNIDDDNNGFVDDVNGWDFRNHDRNVFDNANDDSHGTHVAGIVGARGNNATGVVGVNWNVQLLPMKAIGPNGSTDAILLSAYSYAKAMRQRGVNLRVLNNSYGGQQFSQSLMDAVAQLGEAGILFVAAAGNLTMNNDAVPNYPAGFDLPNVISVAASNALGFPASSFSNRGPQSVHLLAPGEDVLSTTPRGYNGDGVVPALTESDGSTYSRFSGTSMSCPHVAGAAALAVAANTNISMQKLRAAVLAGTDEFFSNVVITNGRLNAQKTVQFALENDAVSPAPAGNLRINSQTGRRVELQWTEGGDDGTTGRASLTEIHFTASGSGKQYRLNTRRAASAGNEQTLFVSIPVKQTTGELSFRTIDDAGNTSTATVAVSIAPEDADPYIVSVGPAAALTAPNTGTLIGSPGDDFLFTGVALKFPFPFFGSVVNAVTVSTNGAIYIPIPPEGALPNPSVLPFLDFAAQTNTNFEHLALVAGMWADLRTDRRGSDGVYMIQPDIDRVIFRWQAVTFGTETPVTFEIELRRDGTIQTRYGNGNVNLNPVLVGISAGDPETHLIATHSSASGPISLTNAESLTFALKNPPPPPIADLSVSVTESPDPVVPGQNLTYNIQVSNFGPSPADEVTMTNVLPAGTTFVSCISSHFNTSCTNSGGTVTGKINILHPVPIDSGIRFTLVVKVDAAPGTALQNSPSASSVRPDPNPLNNSATAITQVVAEPFFGNARAISAGDTHTSSVRNDGTVWTWGLGTQGQLGDGTSGTALDPVRSLTPLQVPGLDGVETVEDSVNFVLALKSNGTVWGWGNNFNGQLGDGTSSFRTRPVQTTGLTNVKGITAGLFFGAAVKTDGTVWVWGSGTGSLIEAPIDVNATPTQVPGLTDVAAIAGGSRHLLILKTDKTVWSLGINTFGQLGDGTATQRKSPVQVTGLSNVSRIAAGEEFSLALKEDGTIWAWGLHVNGAIGPGGGPMNFTPRSSPIQVTGLPAGMTNIAAGDHFCLAIAANGTVWSWGSNLSFQLGQGVQSSQNPTPGQIPNFGNVVSVAGGSHFSVALKSDGSVWAWGGNSQGELGDGSFNIVTSIPVRVSGLQTVNAPVINPQGGNFVGAVDVTITCPTPGATIHYTTNGAVPTENDPVIANGGILRLTSNTVLRARAWKRGLFASGTSFAGFEITIPVVPPVLLLDETGPAANQLAALDSVLLVRDPFTVINPANLLKQPNDPHTRVILFVRNIELQQFEGPGSIFITLTDPNFFVFNLNAEDLRSIPGLDFKQLIFRLPNVAAGTYQVKVRFHNVDSNVGTIRIK
ncbi:MAG TPA: S8 family serine peptidase [Pyrinomonadaceae bacterium]|nr:S8 family serine peptidase [Pyrinomonadaceae bacterium]